MSELKEGPWLFGLAVNLSTVLKKDLNHWLVLTLLVHTQQSQPFLTLFSGLRSDTQALIAIRILAVRELSYDSPAAVLIVLLTSEIRNQKNF